MTIIRKTGVSDRIRYHITAYSYNNAEDKAMQLLIEDGYNMNVWHLKKVVKLFTNTYLVYFE